MVARLVVPVLASTEAAGSRVHEEQEGNSEEKEESKTMPPERFEAPQGHPATQIDLTSSIEASATSV
jgi:hypothetical protein